MRVILSNLHSCHGIIQDFRKEIPSRLHFPFADIVFPEERLSCIMGREVRFLLVADAKGANGCCILALSPEPLRTETLFMHAIRDEEIVLKSLLDNVIALLQSRRAPDLEVKHVEGLHSGLLKEALGARGFEETIMDRMFLEAPRRTQLETPSDQKVKVRNTDSLLNWRALYLSATTSRPFHECRKQVSHETPYGTIQEDDLQRLVAYHGSLPVGTIGYSFCRNIGILERLSVISDDVNRSDIARALLVETSKLIVRRKCDRILMDIDRNSTTIEILSELGFKLLGKVSRFYKVITPKSAAGRALGKE